jgi:hypothetical protein
MGYEMIAGLLCVAWAVLYASRRARPVAVRARARGAIRRG